MSDRVDVCSKCGTTMEKYPDDGSVLEIWRCPACQLRHVFMNYRKMAFGGQGVQIRGRTFDDVDGLPAHESCIAVTPDGDLFEQRIRHKERDVVVERWFELHKPYRRVAGQVQVRQEECSVIKHFLPTFNKAHQSNFLFVIPDPDDREADVIATDPAEHRVRFQVVVADHQIWRALADTGEIYERVNENELFDRIRNVLAKKSLRADSNVILVLDGPWVTTRGTVDRFRRQSETLLAELRFPEIWYSERWPGDLVVKLKG